MAGTRKKRTRSECGGAAQRRVVSARGTAIPRPPIDARGRRIRVGDVVRIVGVPDLSGMTANCRSECEPVFRYLLGKYKRISGWNDLGWAEIESRMLRGSQKGLHWVWLDPCLLRKKG